MRITRDINGEESKPSQRRFHFKSSDAQDEGGRGSASNACIYLQIPNSFQYVEVRLPSVDLFQYSIWRRHGGGAVIRGDDWMEPIV